jgi:ABC-type transport system involved in multi-copper enzyme maturation permease subunit
MLRKGTLDLLLSKPIQRVSLLIYKFIGGLTFMFLNTVVIMVGLWLAIGMQTGVWVGSLLACILVYTFQFAIFYAISTLIGVLTRSAIVAILVSVAAWVPLWGIGILYAWVESKRPENLDRLPAESRTVLPDWVYTTTDIVHWILPRYKDLDILATRMIRQDVMDPESPLSKALDDEYKSIRWFESVTVTLVFITFTVGLACWWFATRDY